MLDIKDFDFHLPQNLIAQKPAKPRDHSRLLVLHKNSNKLEHKHFYEIIDYLQRGDILILNNSKVIPARLIGTKEKTAGKVEIFLHHHLKNNLWQCLIGGKRVYEGLKINFTKKILSKLKKKGIQIEYITLHVGLGTFAPVKTTNIKDHKMHAEWTEVNKKVIKNILEAKKNGKISYKIKKKNIFFIIESFFFLYIF